MKQWPAFVKAVKKFIVIERLVVFELGEMLASQEGMCCIELHVYLTENFYIL